MPLSLSVEDPLADHLLFEKFAHRLAGIKFNSIGQGWLYKQFHGVINGPAGQYVAPFFRHQGLGGI